MRNPNPASVGGNYTVDFLTKKAVLTWNIDFQQNLTEDFRGVENPNLVSDGGKYALDFLTKEAFLSQDIDF